MKRIRFAVPIAMVAAVMCASLAVAADEPATAPGLRPELARIDLGEVLAGAEKTATFTLHNDSAANIRILRAKPS